MSWRNVSIIFKKELVDLSRDRKTLIFMILLPILVIPGMMWVMNRFVESGEKALEEDVSTIAVIGGSHAPELVELLGNLERLGDDPAALAGVKEPLLRAGLDNLLTADELADAMFTAGAIEGMDGDSRDRLGAARFLRTIEFEPQSAPLRAAFEEGLPPVFDDPMALRLASSARRLADLPEETDVATLLETGRFLVADRQRLKVISADERAAVDRGVELLDALGVEIGSGAEAGEYHAVLVLHADFLEALRTDGTASYTLLFDESREKSQAARRKVEAFVDRLEIGVVRARIAEHTLSRGLTDPFEGEAFNLGRSRSVLAIVLPYMVLLMCFVGAIYPAIDLGAGEKERGTLETLLVTPAERVEFVLGKFGMITLAAMVATLLNVLSLVVSAKFGLLPASGGLELDPRAVVLSVLLMLPVAALFAAVLLAISIYAKSFKEAQSYSTPVNFLILIPALASFVPGIELTLPLSFVPLVNVSLALKEAWVGIFKWECLAVILLSSAVYAGAALTFCTRWFQREEVLFRT